MQLNLAPCPLCQSPAIHMPGGNGLDGASCTNPLCILHINHQDDCNRHVLVTEWPTRDIEDLHEALARIVQWSEAYPLDIFPEPDLKKAAELLNAGGITLDAISAHCMRHVVEGVGKIAREALGDK